MRKKQDAVWTEWDESKEVKMQTFILRVLRTAQKTKQGSVLKQEREDNKYEAVNS